MKNKIANIAIILFAVILISSIVVLITQLNKSSSESTVDSIDISDSDKDIQRDDQEPDVASEISMDLQESNKGEVDIPGITEPVSIETKEEEPTDKSTQLDGVADWAQELADNMQQDGESRGWLVEESPSLWLDYWDYVVDVPMSDLPDNYYDPHVVPGAVMYHANSNDMEESYVIWQCYLGLKKYLGISDDSLINGCYIAEQEHYWLLNSFGFQYNSQKYETFLEGDTVYIKINRF